MIILRNFLHIILDIYQNLNLHVSDIINREIINRVNKKVNILPVHTVSKSQKSGQKYKKKFSRFYMKFFSVINKTNLYIKSKSKIFFSFLRKDICIWSNPLNRSHNSLISGQNIVRSISNFLTIKYTVLVKIISHVYFCKYLRCLLMDFYEILYQISLGHRQQTACINFIKYLTNNE